MEIRTYYHENFRGHLEHMMGGRPVPYFGQNWRFDCDELKVVPPNDRAAFLICLYFTVLVDQAMHCYYRPYYARFEELTRYPKFCHGLLTINHNPRGILNLPVKHGLVQATDIVEALPDGMRLFVQEVNSFFRDYLPHLEVHNFFQKLRTDPDVQIPLVWVVLNPEIKNSIDYVAYEELSKAIGIPV